MILKSELMWKTIESFNYKSDQELKHQNAWKFTVNFVENKLVRESVSRLF